ncbi:MAG: hypothetical protein HRU29_06680 [Rhizobiales bacterium]|nr:hypothetical protein [Hyphomicrobiales bacterium]NRB14070.1 hypothetical protein [Hyphomicrobiales bacterium]
MQVPVNSAGALTGFVFTAFKASSVAETPAQNFNITAFQQSPGGAPA